MFKSQVVMARQPRKQPVKLAKLPSLTVQAQVTETATKNVPSFFRPTVKDWQTTVMVAGGREITLRAVLLGDNDPTSQAAVDRFTKLAAVPAASSDKPPTYWLAISEAFLSGLLPGRSPFEAAALLTGLKYR